MSVGLGLGWLMASPRFARSRAPHRGVSADSRYPPGLRTPGRRARQLDVPRGAGPARRIMIAFHAPLVLLPAFALAWWHAGLATAAIHTLYVLALSLCMIEIQLAVYRKIPLTRPMPGFQGNFLIALFP